MQGHLKQFSPLEIIMRLVHNAINAEGSIQCLLLNGMQISVFFSVLHAPDFT